MFTSGKRIMFGTIGLAVAGLLAFLSPAANTSYAQASTATPAPGSSLPAYGEYFLQQFAGRLGVTVDKLKEAYLGAFGDTVDKAVQDEALTQTQAEKLKERAARRVENGRWPGFWDGLPGRGGWWGAGNGPARLGDMMGGCGEPAGALLTIAAEKLGLSVDDLKARVQDGQTIADVAAAQGVALDSIAEAVIAAHKECLDRAVQDGRLTQTQANRILEQMKNRITERLQNQFPPPTPGRLGPDGVGGGRGGRWGGGDARPAKP